LGGEYSQTFVATPIVVLFNDLRAAVIGVGPGKSLVNKVRHAEAYYTAQDKQATCSMLSGFVNEVKAQKSKKISKGLAKSLINDARDIKMAIGCGNQ